MTTSDRTFPLFLFFAASLSISCSAAGTSSDGPNNNENPGNMSSGGTTGTMGTGGTGGSTPASGGASSTGGAGSGGTTGSGGGAMVEECTPNPAGTLVVDGDVVRDETTCLTWMKGSLASADIAGYDTVHVFTEATFWDAEIACEQDTTGGYDDWRVPSLDELQSILTECQKWEAPHMPWSIDFDDANTSLWTALPVGEKYCSVDLQAGGTASSTPSSGPGVRCVRGVGNVGAGANCGGCPL